MILAETERLYLRALEKTELPRLAQLLNVWDIARWLPVLPFPYTPQDADSFYRTIEPFYTQGRPQFYALALKSDNLLIGGVGLHPPRFADAEDGEVEIGYWLAKDFWGRGLMSEAARESVKTAFARPGTRCVGATTDLKNLASQTILSKLGLRNKGIIERNYPALRGETYVVRWLITRAEHERSQR